MHNKNNNKTQTFIQGLRPFSSSIPKTLKKHLRKGGYNYSSIVDNWTKTLTAVNRGVNFNFNKSVIDLFDEINNIITR